MFRLVNIISNVKYHIIVNNDNDLIYLKENTLYVNDIPILYGNNVFDFNAFGKTVYIAENGMVNFKNYENNFQTKFNKSATVSFINENEALLYYGSDDYLKNYVGRFDIFNKSFKWKIEGFVGRGLIVKNHLFSGINNTFISKIDLYHPAQPLWQFDLSQLSAPSVFADLYEKDEPYRVLKIIGILDDKLWVALNHYTLLALDIKTGKLVYQLSEIENFNYPYGNIIPAPESMKIDKERNVLYALAWEYYWEVNPKTGEIQMWDLFEYFQSLKLRNDLILNYVKIDDIIYFASRNDDCNYESQLAGFDVNTKKIVWQHKFQTNDNGKIPQINDLKGNSNILGALDRDNVLHIFKKNQNAVT